MSMLPAQSELDTLIERGKKLKKDILEFIPTGSDVVTYCDKNFHGELAPIVRNAFTKGQDLDLVVLARYEDEIIDACCKARHAVQQDAALIETDAENEQKIESSGEWTTVDAHLSVELFGNASLDDLFRENVAQRTSLRTRFLEVFEQGKQQGLWSSLGVCAKKISVNRSSLRVAAKGEHITAEQYKRLTSKMEEALSTGESQLMNTEKKPFVKSESGKTLFQPLSPEKQALKQRRGGELLQIFSKGADVGVWKRNYRDFAEKIGVNHHFSKADFQGEGKISLERLELYIGKADVCIDTFLRRKSNNASAEAVLAKLFEPPVIPKSDGASGVQRPKVADNDVSRVYAAGNTAAILKSILEQVRNEPQPYNIGHLNERLTPGEGLITEARIALAETLLSEFMKLWLDFMRDTDVEKREEARKRLARAVDDFYTVLQLGKFRFPVNAIDLIEMQRTAYRGEMIPEPKSRKG